MSKNTFHGIFPALVTPMDRHGEVDLKKLAAFVDYHLDKGMHGIMPMGSTGEFYALSPSERGDVLRTVIDTVSGRVPVVPGTNAGSTRDVITYSRQAEAAGAAGVLLAAPYYSLPTGKELLAHFKAVNDAIGIPIMVYNYPGRTGVDITPDLLARLAEKCKNVRYVKESTGEMARMAQIQRLCGDRVNVFCGCDTIALQAFVTGAVGWVGGVANAIPACHVKLYELAVEKQDYKAAWALYDKMLPLMELMEGGGKYTQFVKAATKLMGHDVGAPRGPLAAATAPEVSQIKKVLRLCEAAERGRS